MKNPLFVVMGPVRGDLSGLPYGFMFIWKPRYGAAEPYDPVPCSFKIGFHWYPWWHLSWYQDWKYAFPWIDF